MARLTEIAGRTRRFYQRRIRSGWVLGAGDSGFKFFQSKEAAAIDRNYDYNKNFFRHNAGTVLQMRGYVYAPSYATVSPTGTYAQVKAIMDQLHRLVSLCDVTIMVEDGKDHETRLRNLTGGMPQLMLETTANNLAVLPSLDEGGMMTNSLRRGDNFAPVITIETDRVPTVNAALPAGEVIGSGVYTGIAGYIIELEATIEEYPQDQAAIVRAAA